MLTILGGGGWLPAHGRHTACALIRNGAHAVMIDAGTGVARALERPELFEGLETLDIVLTHFHLDHVVGLAYLPAVRVSERMTVWGPGRLLYETTTKAVLESVWREPFHPVELEQGGIEVRDLPGNGFELLGLSVATRRQDRHTAPTMGLRFGDELAWVTDTAYDPGSAGFAAGVEMLAHEVWFESHQPRNADVHSSAAHAAEIAATAGASRLLLIHLPPFSSSADGLVEEARRVVPDSVAAEDGLQFDLGRERSQLL